MIKSSLSLQCSNCRKYIYTNLFESHTNFCFDKEKNENDINNINENNKIYKINVIEAKVIHNDEEKPFIQYLINIKNLKDPNNQWQICKRIKQVNNLQKKLEELFENDLPSSALIMKQ